MIGRCRKMFDSNNTLQDFRGFVVSRRRWYDSRTIDEIYSAHEGDILPDLGLARNRGHITDFLLLERVDDGGFTNVGISNKTNRDLFAI